MDNNPRSGLNYYRLKQTDYDRQFSYSDIETVKFGTNNTIKVYPTMVHNVLTIETGDEMDGDLTVLIRDLTGRDFDSFVIPSKSTKKELSLNSLIPGSYFVVIYNNESVETYKFIKL